LYQVVISNEPPSIENKKALEAEALKKYKINKNEAIYFVFTDTIKNNAYRVGDGNINILMKDNSVQDITTASDNSNLGALAKTVEKYIFCYIKDLKHVN
jgi:hypothetical protein